MLLSIDWDAFSGTRELVFDAPIWGTPDREFDRLEAWRERADKRGGPGGGRGWDSLAVDFPLYAGWEKLKQYAGIPTWAAVSHAEAFNWLRLFEVQDVLNIDSHHDLSSFSGDRARLRPGNWAGLALRNGLISTYTCQYPIWHADLAVAEGHDLIRTHAELAALLPAEVLRRVCLTRSGVWPAPAQLSAILLVQSPAWASPAHDWAFEELTLALGAQVLTSPQPRPYEEFGIQHSSKD